MKTLIAGNWKMHLTPAESVQLAEEIKVGMEGMSLSIDVLICPTYISLSSVNAHIAGSNILLGAQNMHPEKHGAYTGEISPDMLIAVGCSYVLCGHSERRHIFNETDEFINQKVRRALQFGLKPVLCVGETEKERELGLTTNIVERQLKTGLAGIDESQIEKIVIAYEPVWAIGTGKTATPELAQEVHSSIRNLLVNQYSRKGKDVRILYGGSVKPENIDALLDQPDINGVLVGGASLKADSFLYMIKSGQLHQKKA